MQKEEQANKKEVSEYFFNDPEEGEKNLKKVERENQSRRSKRYDTQIMRTEGKKTKG